MAKSKTPSAVRSVIPDRDVWLGTFSSVFTRVVLFGIEGTSAKVTGVRGLSDLLVGTTVSLADQTPLRWAIEAASPIVGAGRSPSGEIMAKVLKLAAPRAFAVVPLVIGKKLAGLVYGDRGSDPLPLASVSDVFAECEKLLNPLLRPAAPPPERAAFRSSARRDQRIRRAPRPKVIRTKALLAEIEDQPATNTTAPPTLGVEAPLLDEAPPVTEPAPPPVPESKRITAVQEPLQPWTPFADVAAGDELAAAFASVATPSIPLPSSSPATPFAEPVIDELPEFAAEDLPAVAPLATARADTPLFPSVTPDLGTPVAIPRDVLVRAERLVNEQVTAHRRNRWVFAVAGASSFALCLFFLAPMSTGKSTHEVVTLPAEATPAMIGRVLADAHLVRSAKGFALVGELVGLSGLRAGSYSLTTGQWPWHVARELTDGGSALHDVVIESGLTLGETAGRLEKAGVVAAADFVEAAHDQRLLRKFAITNDDAQGWLAPGTYAFADEIAAQDIVTIMIERCMASLASIGSTRELTPEARNDVMVLASIVEREAKDKSEAPRIAGLFANRLKLGMRLESRATAVYIIGIDKKELTLADVRQPSPYNTYVNAGLPPAPIASPSFEALRAAADPEPNTYYYMTDKEDGGHVFSQTYEEHLKAQRANR